MKIRKKEQSFGILGKIINSMSQSKNDTYSCDYINNLEVVPKILYENFSGGNDTINLTDSVDNYSRIVVQYKTNQMNIFKTMEVYEPSGKSICLDYFEVANTSVNQLAGSVFNCIGNQLIYSSSCMINLNLDGSIITEQDNKLIYITKVIGYEG